MRQKNLTIAQKAKSISTLIEWNNTKADYPADKTVHQLFEEQVKKTPHNIAVRDSKTQLTYKELNERANQLAHYFIQNYKLDKEAVIGVCLERSVNLIVSLLGLMKANLVYVPIDPSSPKNRIDYILKETQASIIVTNSIYKNIFLDNAIPLLCLDKKRKLIEVCGIENLLGLTTSNSVIYTIYTSGSTGNPKGVILEHKGIVNLIHWYKGEFQLNKNDISCQFASFSFDVFMCETFPFLLSGGTVFLVNEDIKKSPPDFLNWLDANKITFCELPVSLGLMVLEEELPKTLSLRVLKIGGEKVRGLPTKMFPFDIVNIYGPTEVSVDSLFARLYSSSPTPTYHFPNIAEPPIGKPIYNLEAYIVDKHMQPVPIGVIGEICISGVGVGRGYLSATQLTATKFIENPFSQNKNNRLYKTGDLGRYLPDGNIEFVRRIDDQVKIRGFRIELGEIESTLVNHGDVSQVVVMAREDEPANKKLVAYIVPEVTKASSFLTQESFSSSSQDSFSILGGDSLPALTEDLRNHLAHSLPEYMVPSFFVYLDKIPLTSNGKIDRKSLPAPDLSLRTIGDEYVAPQSDLQHSLAAIWSEVLKVEHIGIHDNFFKIGGDSIISIQLVAKGRQQGIHFNVKDIFTYPTIAGLASVARTQEDVLTLKPDQSPLKGDVALTPIQSWFFDQGLKDINHFNQAVFLKARNSLDPSLLTQALKLLISHHDALRFRYSQHQSWRQECVENAEAFPDVLTVLNFSHILDTDLASRIEEESSLLQQTLNIETGPLIKVALFDCGIERPSRLLIIIHHLVVDGVSWRILLEDLERIYNQLAAGNKPTLLSKTHSYQQWAHALKEYASSESLAKENLYWKKIEGGIKPLPVDFNKGAANGSVLSTMTVSLTTQETTDLLQKVPEAYRTQINDILLTALLLAIGDWKGSYDLSLSLEGHGREDIIKDIDLSKTVGWFTSIFPVCLNIEDPNDLATAIKIVKEELRQIPHKGIGYGILTYLTPHSPLGPSSQPTLSFNYLGQWDNTLASEGLFSFAHESVGKNVSELNTSHHLLDINAEVKEGTLHVTWTYSQNHFSQLTIEKLSHNFIHRLKQLIHHCCQDHNFGYTPSDFDLTKNKKSLQRKINFILKNSMGEK
ncbi:MAG: amino acid adenylation domain-containing protein [Alphaproteobacteria bacterium]|nr:amino acid adenylation domain-containing protein [Alphaproteobacteria bacterium]